VSKLGLRIVGCVPVDHEGSPGKDPRQPRSAEADKALLSSRGERTPDGPVLPFQPGIGLVLNRAPAPIVRRVAVRLRAYPERSNGAPFAFFWKPNRGRWVGSRCAGGVR